MTILTIPCLLPGGTEFQTLHLVKALIKLNQTVVVLVYFEVEEDMLNLYQKEGATVRCLHWSRFIKPWSFIQQLKTIFKELNPDIVHVQYMAPGLLPIIAAKLARVQRIIATVHQPYTKSHGWKAKWMLRLAARFCHPFLAVSQNAENSWFGSAHLIQNKVPIHKQSKHLTFYNMVDVANIQQLAANTNVEQVKEQLGLSGKTIVGAVSRLRHEKGIDLLLHAFISLAPKQKNLHLLLVGDGPDRIAYENLVTENKISQHVSFYGAAEWEKAIGLMEIMDIVVIPSRFEGFGLTAAEAMALGKPIVATNNFGLQELITHEKEGLLFTNEDANALTKALEGIFTHKEMEASYGQVAQEKVKRLFDRPVFEENVKTLYGL